MRLMDIGTDKKAWVVAVNMGYGHQRTAYPLRYFANGGKIINANDYEGIPAKDRKTWEDVRKIYEFVSRLKRIPFVGEIIFAIMDEFQKILSYYPKRDLSEQTLQLKQTYSTIKKGWGGHLIEKLKSQNSNLKTDSPLISTFFTAAFMAEFFNYPGKIFCVVCDADISRAWAPLKPKESRIKYFTPTERVAERLKLYGVKEENIFFTGYPLPQDIIGGEGMEILKEDLKSRLLNLDPKRKYCEKYKILIKDTLGELPQEADHTLTLMFAVGGAGAQKEIGIKIAQSLKGKVRVILVAGIKKEVRDYFLKNAPGVEIIFADRIDEYFQKFNQALRKTDILWTKPSELSFYSALGLPIIIAPPIGSQEEFNKRWLLKSGFGNLQENPKYTDQWLFDWLSQGYLAESAMQGFIEGEKLGTINIQKICRG